MKANQNAGRTTGTALTRLWNRNPPLALLCLTMLISLGIFTVALYLDPRILNGQLLWIKPAKFAVSILLYSATLIWMLEFVEGSERTLRIVKIASWIIAAMFVVEVVAIFGQAARGRISHFNISTVEDAVVFNVMGTAIMTLFVAHVVITWIVLRQRTDEPTFTAGLRAGLLVAALGMLVGYLMVIPTSEQIELMGQGVNPGLSGSHTVGAPDGGPGLPLTGWSTEAGDLRIAHFFGMHAMQILPLFALWLRRRTNRAALPDNGTQLKQRTYVRIFAVMYAGVTLALTVQALRGESFAHPGAITIASFAAIIIVGAFAFWRVKSSSPTTNARASGQPTHNTSQQGFQLM